MAFPSAAERLKRILVMVPWINAHPGTHVEELCTRFDIDQDTLMADLDAVMTSGVPPFTPLDYIEVWNDAGRVTLRLADHVAKPPRLTPDEARDLVLRARAVAALPGLEESDALNRAIEKLSAALGDLNDGIGIHLDVPGAEHAAPFRAACRDGATLRLSYYSHGRGEMTEREIEPHNVFYANGAWYVGARDVALDEDRTFRLDRVRTFAPTGKTFDAAPTTDGEARKAGLVIPPSPDDLDVTLDLRPRARWIAEEVPHEKETKRPDGTLRIHLRTGHLGWLVRLLLAAGGNADVVAPAALRTALEEAARAALVAYGEVPTQEG